MICPVCGGNIYTNLQCDSCAIAYNEMINFISHNRLRQLINKTHLTEDEELMLAKELEDSSFLLPAVIMDDAINVMTASDENNRNYILLFTDRSEYDKNNLQINPITNPFDEVLSLLDSRLDGFVINICSEAFVIDRQFIEKYFN